MGVENRLTDLDFWTSRQSQVIRLPLGGAKPAWFKHVAQHLRANSAWTCLEVGVVPGNTLLFFGSQNNYSCTGIDFSPRVTQLNDVFAAQGVEARFLQKDFLTWETAERFNLVYSCGFVEHFENFREVIEKHWALVKPEGMMLLTVPVLTPIQLWSRVIFYKRSKLREVLDSHNLEIMDLDRLQHEVELLSGSEVLVSSYTSEMEFWFRLQTSGVRWWAWPMFWPLKALDKVVRKIGVSSRWYSPMILVLVRKVS